MGPLGGDVGTSQPVEDDPGRDYPLFLGALRNANGGCLMDGLAIPCTVAGEIEDYNRRAGSRGVRMATDNSATLADRLRGRVGPRLRVESDHVGRQLSLDLSDGWMGGWFGGVGGAPYWGFGGGEPASYTALYSRDFGAPPQGGARTPQRVCPAGVRDNEGERPEETVNRGVPAVPTEARHQPGQGVGCRQQAAALLRRGLDHKRARAASIIPQRAVPGIRPASRRVRSSPRRLPPARAHKAGQYLVAAPRKALYFPAITALRCSPFFQAWAGGLRQRGKSKMAVIGAAMRKLVRLAYGVLKTGRPFDPEWTQKQKTA